VMLHNVIANVGLFVSEDALTLSPIMYRVLCIHICV
jgi:hypothetical protein